MGHLVLLNSKGHASQCSKLMLLNLAYFLERVFGGATSPGWIILRGGTWREDGLNYLPVNSMDI